MPEVTVQDLIRKTASGLGVPPELALAVAEQESSFNPTAIGPEITTKTGKTRAVGTFQLLPDTAKGLGIDPSDPTQNIVGGVRYLRQLLDKHQGDLHKTLAEYGGVVNDTAYVPSVMGRLSKFQQVADPSAAPVVPAVTGRGAGAGPSGAPGVPSPVGGRTAGPGGGGGATMGATTSTFSGLDAAVRPFDPLQPEGRQNLAATAGAVALAATVPEAAIPAAGMRIVPWIARAIAGPLGAAVGGAAAEATEEALGTQPQTPGAVADAGLKQGAYELGGQVLLWPVRRLLKGFLGSSISRNAKSALDARMAGAVEERSRATAVARSQVEEGIAATKAMARAGVESTREGATLLTREARKSAAARLSQVELDNAALITAAREQYDNLLAQPPSIQGVAGTVRQVLEGPAKAALDKAGEHVATVAATGPDVAMKPIKDALTEITQKFRPDSIFAQTDAASQDAIGFVSGLSSVQRSAIAAQVGSQSADAAAIAKALNLPADHPLPGILGRVQAAPETISFADAHKLKMLLDEAVNWDRVAKKSLEKITKGLRNTLRQELGSYEPYNTATAAYQAVIPLYRRGVGKQVSRAAIDAPDQIAKVLKADRPADALALKQLLIDQSAAGGDPALGQEAWDSVRAAWTHQNLLSGGVDGLQDRVKHLLTERPEFAKITFGDLTGLRVLSHLDAIGEAYAQALGKADASKEATKVANKSAEEIVRDTTRAAVRDARAQSALDVEGARSQGRTALTNVTDAARAGVTAARQAKKDLAESSLRQGTIMGQGADILRAAFQGPQSVWGALSIMRLLKGPQSGDLLAYVAYSPRLTQAVTSILLGQAPDRVVSDTMREIMSVLSPSTPTPMASHAASQEAPVGQPQPVPAHAR